MSEYQYIAFRAVDGPVSDKNLKYMEQQSTRAKITPWTFDNEYSFGGFRGHTDEMLRRGYDVFFHFANFGVRRLMIRLPRGLPNPASADLYLKDELITYTKDKTGPGGVVCISPELESGTLPDLWNEDFHGLATELAGLHTEILDGDLRPFYLLHLIFAGFLDDEDQTLEPPVPAGLHALTAAQEALCRFYDISESIVAAAAEKSPKIGSTGNSQTSKAEWLKNQAADAKDEWLLKLMQDSQPSVRSEILAAFRSHQSVPEWPTIPGTRTINQIIERAEEVEKAAREKKKAAAARKQAQHLTEMAADPEKILSEVDALIAKQQTSKYEAAAKLLGELNQALAATNQTELAMRHALKIKDQYPSRNRLHSLLRKAGFLKKS